MTSIFSKLQPAYLPPSGNDLLLLDQVNPLSPTGYTTRRIASGTMFAAMAYAQPTSVKQYGAKGDGVTNDTAAINAAAIAIGVGGTLYFPAGTYAVSGTLAQLPGQIWLGVGWHDTAGTFLFGGGSVILQKSLSNIATLSRLAASDAVNASRGGWVNLALLNSVPGATVGTGIQTLNARQLMLKNVAVFSFNTGLDFGANSWQYDLEQVLVYDAATCMFPHDGGGEDSTYQNCIFRGYRTTSIGVHPKNQCQRMLFNSCDFSNNQLGIFAEQGDVNGDGTGAPLPMEITVISGQFENCTTAGVRSVSSSQPGPIGQYASLTLRDCRGFIATSPNTGQILIDAQKASRVELVGGNFVGYSTGVQIGAVSNTPQISEVHLDNPQSTWGTAEVACTTPNGLAKVFRSTGPRPSASFTATSFSPATPSAIPFSVVVSDTETWYFLNGSTPTIRLRRPVRTRFEGTLRWSSVTAGAFKVELYKNSAPYLTVFEQTVGATAMSFTFSVEDPAPALLDNYNLVVTPAGASTLDITQSVFSAETSL